MGPSPDQPSEPDFCVRFKSSQWPWGLCPLSCPIQPIYRVPPQGLAWVPSSLHPVRTSYTAVLFLTKALHKLHFSIPLGVRTSGKSCLSVVHPLRRREVRAQDSRRYGGGALVLWASALPAPETNHPTLAILRWGTGMLPNALQYQSDPTTKGPLTLTSTMRTPLFKFLNYYFI